jgi:ectoine hydroxylase-related dioxygenase (phytanoyl-CoA dioxygenase family)
MAIQAGFAAHTDSVTEDVLALRRDGVVGKKGVFSREFIERLREDMMTAFWEAIQRPGGTVSRGPRRWYVELHPQAVSGFVDLVSHPWITAMAEAVLGPEYQIVEVGFDTPFQGAQNQPWHRDFPSPKDTYEDHRITSLAFNLTGVDVTPDMGPFEVAPGTQWDDGRSWKHEMFPDPATWSRYAAARLEVGPPPRPARNYPARATLARASTILHRAATPRKPASHPYAGVQQFERSLRRPFLNR